VVVAGRTVAVSKALRGALIAVIGAERARKARDERRERGAGLGPLDACAGGGRRRAGFKKGARDR
jgi:hypothetical protein